MNAKIEFVLKNDISQFNFTCIKYFGGLRSFDWLIVCRYVEQTKNKPFQLNRCSHPFQVFFVLVPFSKYGYFFRTRIKKDLADVAVADARLGFSFVGHQSVASRSPSERREEVSVLGRVRSVDQQPSSEPEVGEESREQQQPRDNSTVSREEKEQAGVDNVTNSSGPHRHSEVAREDSPHADASSKHDHVHASEDCDY